jgi:release factor glutamine methyltransferase
MTLESALRQGSKLLEEAGIPAPCLTAEVLLCHALGRERSYLYGHPEEELTNNPWIHYGRYLHERLNGKPTQYITRVQEFYGRIFQVSPDVLIPRPETEHLVETALRLAPNAQRILDIGCGSGAIAVTLQLETRASVFATDISPAAVAVARWNTKALGAKVGFVVCDVASAIAPGSIDLLISNPPYIPLSEGAGLQREIREHEPPTALFPGPSGLELYRRILADAPRLLRPGGWLMVEIGYRQEEDVRKLLAAPLWQNVETVRDLAGLPRVLAARYLPPQPTEA